MRVVGIIHIKKRAAHNNVNYNYNSYHSPPVTFTVTPPVPFPVSSPVTFPVSSPVTFPVIFSNSPTDHTG